MSCGWFLGPSLFEDIALECVYSIEGWAAEVPLHCSHCEWGGKGHVWRLLREGGSTSLRRRSTVQNLGALWGAPCRVWEGWKMMNLIHGVKGGLGAVWKEGNSHSGDWAELLVKRNLRANELSTFFYYRKLRIEGRTRFEFTIYPLHILGKLPKNNFPET